MKLRIVYYSIHIDSSNNNHIYHNIIGSNSDCHPFSFPLLPKPDCPSIVVMANPRKQPTEAELLQTSAGYVQAFPAPGLRRNIRIITGHNAEGKGVFLSTDCGDHHRIIGNEQAIANIIYSTNETPVEMSGDVDLKYAKENEVWNETIRSSLFF